MATIVTSLSCDLQSAVKVQYLNGNLFSQDNQANRFDISVFDGGEAAAITGAVSADVIRADGGTVAVTGGTISGNVASITFPAAVYAIPGVVSIVVKITASSVVTTIAAVVANVYRSSTDTAVDPGTIIPSIQTLISAIETAVASIPADYSSLWTSLAPAFSSSTSYVAGQYVTYNGAVYRFNTAHSGAWSSGDVSAVNIGGELTSLKSALNKSNRQNMSSDSRFLMDFDPAYSAGEFQGLKGTETVTINGNEITFSASGTPSAVYCACVSDRNYFRTKTNGLFVLSIKYLASTSQTNMLVVNSNNGKAYRIIVGDNNQVQYPTTIIEIPAGNTSDEICIYIENGNIVFDNHGTKTVVDITAIPIVKDNTSYGYWEIPTFGVCYFENDPKTIVYAPDKYLNKFDSFIETELMQNTKIALDYDAAYLPGDFKPITGLETVTVSGDEVTITAGGSDDSKYCGVVSIRPYISFRENAFYLLALAQPSFTSYTCALIVNANNGKIYTAYIGDSELKLQALTANVGSDINHYGQAYLHNEKIVLFCKGAQTIIDVTTIPYVPNNTSYGYWKKDEICFGIITTQDGVKKLTHYMRNGLTSKLHNKTIYYALGDSLTAGSYSNPESTDPDPEKRNVAVNPRNNPVPWSYPNRIADALGCVVHNLGIPGGSSTRILNEELPDVGSDATLVTVMTGTNDYSQGEPLGSYTDTGTSTLMGRIYNIISGVYEVAPTARIVLISPFTSAGDLGPSYASENYRRGHPSSATVGWTYDEMVEQYKLFCNKYGIQLINATQESPMNSFNLFDFALDWTHPTKEAYGPLAQYIYSQLF